MKRLKVCHFTCAHEADDVRVFQKECVSLAKGGYEVYLVAPNAKEGIFQGVNIINVSAKYGGPVTRLFTLARKVYKKALEINADVYHFHDIEMFWFGIKLKRKGKIVIFDSHEDWPQYIKEISWMPSMIRRFLSKFLTQQYIRHLNKFNRVITVSPHIVENIQKFWAGFIDVVSNYPILTDNLIQIDEDEYTKRASVICYAGTVYKNSCQEEIIQAIQFIEDLEYRIVGKIDPIYKQQLQSLDVKRKVRFIDWVSKAELQQIYLESTIGIIVFEYSPNVGFKQGTMGNNKVFEYMSIGLPIICTNFTLWREFIVNKYNCGIAVEPNSINEIRDAITLLCEDKKLAYNMGVSGQLAVMKEFNWGTQEHKLLEFYSELL